MASGCPSFGASPSRGDEIPNPHQNRACSCSNCSTAWTVAVFQFTFLNFLGNKPNQILSIFLSHKINFILKLFLLFQVLQQFVWKEYFPEAPLISTWGGSCCVLLLFSAEINFSAAKRAP